MVPQEAFQKIVRCGGDWGCWSDGGGGGGMGRSGRARIRLDGDGMETVVLGFKVDVLSRHHEEDYKYGMNMDDLAILFLIKQQRLQECAVGILPECNGRRTEWGIDWGEGNGYRRVVQYTYFGHIFSK